MSIYFESWFYFPFPFLPKLRFTSPMKMKVAWILPDHPPRKDRETLPGQIDVVGQFPEMKTEMETVTNSPYWTFLGLHE